MIAWAVNFVVHKAALAIMPPVGFTFARFALASVVMLGLCRWVEGGVVLPRRDLGRVLALGALGFGVYQVVWPIALVHTTAGNSALLVASSPMFTALVSISIGIEPPNRARFVGAAISFVGVGLVVAGGAAGLAGPAAGDLLTVVAAACWGTYLALGARLLPRVSPLRMTTWAIVAGTAVLAVPGSWQLATADLGAAGPGIALAIAYAGIVAAGLANVVVLRGVVVLGPNRIAVLQFLTPAFTVILAALVLGETVTVAQVAGGLVIVAGILVARRVPPARLRGSAPAAVMPAAGQPAAVAPAAGPPAAVPRAEA